MRKKTTPITAILIGVVFVAQAAAQLRAVRAQTPPRIDGQLDDPCWKQAPVWDEFIILDTDKASPLKTEVRFAWDDYKLYVAMRCFTPDVSLVKANATGRNANVISGRDSVELMIDADRDADAYIHLMTNASASRYDRRVSQGGWVGNVDWNGEWQTAAKIGADSYVVEFAIPFFDLDIGRNTGKTLNVNVCRNVRLPGGTSAYTSVAQAGAYNTPARFRSLEGVEADLGKYMIHVGALNVSKRFADKQTHVAFDVQIENESDQPRDVRVESWLIDLDEKVRVRSGGALTLNPSSKQALTFDSYALQTSGDYTAWLVVYDGATGKPLKISKSALRIDCLPIALRIVEPFYRNTIFASQNLETVRVELEVGLEPAELSNASVDLEVVPKDGGGAIVRQDRRGLGQVNRFDFANTLLPDGEFIVRATLKDQSGQALAETSEPLCKLPYKNGEVWYGRDRVLRRDGTPMFPNGTWGLTTAGHNFYLRGIFTERVFPPSEPGKLRVWYYTSSADDGELKGEQPFSEAFLNDVRQRIRFFRDDPDILAWVQPDEPEVGGNPPSKLEQLYALLREEDPYHPIWVSNDSVAGVEAYADCADASVPHPYPPARPDLPIGDFSSLLHVQRAYLNATKEIKPVGFMHQGFNYGEYVEGRRMPTYYEMRNQNVLALAAGATFLMGFESSTPQTWYPEISIGLNHLIGELNYLGRAVRAPDAAEKVSCPSPDVVTLVKSVDDQLFVFVSNASNEARTLAVTVEGLADRNLSVVSEARSIASSGGIVADAFDPWQTHVYTTASDHSDLKPIDEITGMIEAEYDRRHKPGNLAFQRWADQSVSISFSSRAGEYPPQPWHICDGITDPSVYASPFANLHVWSDATPNESPDWVELKFPGQRRIDRVAVYTSGPCVKDYQIQIMRRDEWVDVAAARDNTLDHFEHAFDPVVTHRVRLLVTAVEGPHAVVTELEVYGEK